jgi:hypothetical protein
MNRVFANGVVLMGLSVLKTLIAAAQISALDAVQDVTVY